MGQLPRLFSLLWHGYLYHVKKNLMEKQQRKDFKFFFSWAMHGEAEHPSSTHARETFWILINKYGNKH